VSSAVEGPKANGGLGFSHLEGQSEEQMSNDEGEDAGTAAGRLVRRSKFPPLADSIFAIAIR
jgi:hypothetical protein